MNVRQVNILVFECQKLFTFLLNDKFNINSQLFSSVFSPKITIIMDVLSPELMWISNRCYRVNPTLENSNTKRQKTKVKEYIEQGK